MFTMRLYKAAYGWSEDQASHMGAALAYYSLFSLAPLLLMAISMIGLFYGEEETRRRIVQQVERLSDEQSAEAVNTLLDNFRGGRNLAGLSVVGLTSLVFGATGMFTSLRSSLHRIWRIDTSNESLVFGLAKTYVVALVMVVIACAFLLVLLMVSTFLPLITKRLANEFPAIPHTGFGVDFGISVLLLTLLLAFTFRVLSDRQLTYRQVTGGAFVSAVLFALGKIALGYYFTRVNLASAYGAAGSLVVFLAWVYYSAQIVFYGAEFIRFGLPQPLLPQVKGAGAGAGPAS